MKPDIADLLKSVLPANERMSLEETLMVLSVMAGDILAMVSDEDLERELELVRERY